MYCSLDDSKSLLRSEDSEEIPFEELDEEQKIAKCYQNLENEKQRRFIELINFIEDIALSDEFTEYINKCNNKMDNGVQCDGVSARKVEEPNDIETIPIATKKVTLVNIIRKKQEKTINKIRAIIYEARIKYECTVRAKETKQLEERKKIFSQLKIDYGIDLRYLDYKSKVVDKVIKMRKISYIGTCTKEQRKLQIIRKILYDYKRDLQIKQQLNKNYNYKARRKTIEMYTTRNSYPSIEMYTEDDNFEELEDLRATNFSSTGTLFEFEEQLENSKENVDKSTELVGKGRRTKTKIKGAKKKTKEKKAKRKKAKMSVKTKSKSKKSDKKSKKKKIVEKENPELILPYIPQTNSRKKIIPDKVTCEAIISGINYVNSLDKLIASFEKEKDVPEDRLFPEDKEFICSPKGIVIKGFENGKRYINRLEITNTSNRSKKCRFHRIFYITEEDDADLVQVASPGVLLLAPGISAKIPVIFRPLISMDTIQCKLVFITYESQRNYFGQLTVHFTGCIREANITFAPSTVRFESVPIWHVRKIQIYETVTFVNTGKDLGRICIRKVSNDGAEDQDDLPSQMSDDKAQGEMHYYSEFCLENVFSYFAMQSYYFDIKPAQEIKFKILFKSAEHIGFYVESYQVFIYKQTSRDCMILSGIQDMFITANTTGYSVNVEPTIVDYEVCVYNSIYQQTFCLENTTRNTLRCVLKFPNCLKDYFIDQKSEILIQGFAKQTVSLKFLPREDLLKDYCEFFDKETGVLEFPLKIETIVCDSIKQPARKLIIYAILVQPLGVFLRPNDNFILETKYDNNCNKEIVRYAISLGDCSTKEFISTQIEIVNNTNCSQHFGFTQLPKHFILSPNYGFGVLNPFQSEMLTMFFVPERRQIFDISDKLVVNTIKNLGKMRKTLNSSKLCKRLKQLEHSLLTSYNENLLMTTMFHCNGLIKEHPDYLKMESVNLNDTQSSRTDIDKTIDTIEILMGITQYNMQEDESCNYNSERSKLEAIKNLVEDDKLALIANITDVLLDFSAQYIRFKDTPCGSVSIATIYLQAYRSYMDQDPCIQKKLKKYEYSATFEITGDNPDIQIEPTCGILNVGEKAKIYLVAKPQLKDEDILTEAKNIKIQELTKLKRAQIKLQMEKDRLAKLAKVAKKKGNKSKKQTKKKDKKAKKGKKKKGKNKKDKKSRRSNEKVSKEEKAPAREESIKEIRDEDIIVEIKDEDISLKYFDYYPAEMCLWRDMKPYIIEGNFVCTINYLNNIELQVKEDLLQLKAVCKVIRPQITHNLTTQYFDFGSVIMGTSVTKMFEIQNISYDNIILNISRTNPSGPYRISDFSHLSVAVEYIARFPVVFNPLLEEQFLEYIEVTTETTTIPVILKGRGVFPDITFLPLFTIVRMDCANNTFTASPIQISNKTNSEVPLRFEKVCELKGYIRPEQKEIKEPPKLPNNIGKKKKGKKGKKGNSSKSSKSAKSSKATGKSKKTKIKGKKQKIPKLSKYSEFLTDLEQYSLANNFEKLLSSNFFNITLGSTSKENDVVIPANTKTVINVQFGAIPGENVKEEKENKSKKKKGKGSKKDKSSKKSKKSSKKSNKSSKKSKKSNKKSEKMSKVSEKTLKKEMAKTCVPPDSDTLCYVCKYNVLLGHTTFFKDIIIIGYFK